MECVRSYNELSRQTITGRDQYWYYVILLNPHDLSPAGKVLIENLDYFHLDSGKKVVYFLPGFLQQPGYDFVTRFFRRLNMPRPSCNKFINNFGIVDFFADDFVKCVHSLENNNRIKWRYSGECELLLFNLDENKKIILNDFYSYNLDDIVRNNRNISVFIRETINIGSDAPDRVTAKRRLDEAYSELIMPPITDSGDDKTDSRMRLVRQTGFNNHEYYFISYSTKDYNIVDAIRSDLEQRGVKCWMAPRDIPRGTNYAHIIETAIMNSGGFILMLSESSVWSVWVEKELLRAIHYFRHENADRIVAIWVREPKDLDGTPMAFPLEGLQIAGTIRHPRDCYCLLPKISAETMEYTDREEAIESNEDKNNQQYYEVE